MEKTSKYRKPLYMSSIDYEKDFDSNETVAVLKAIRQHGLGEI